MDKEEIIAEISAAIYVLREGNEKRAIEILDALRHQLFFDQYGISYEDSYATLSEQDKALVMDTKW